MVSFSVLTVGVGAILVSCSSPSSYFSADKQTGGTAMITLNYRDARPIYEQVRDGLRRLIVSGAIADGEKLPSVRALASQLAINPNTIQRAYSELESEGYAASVPGKGSFAVRRERAEDDARRLALIDTLRETLRELRALGMSCAELDAIYREEEEK